VGVNAPPVVRIDARETVGPSVSVDQAHLADCADVVPAELQGALAKDSGAHKAEQRLRSGQEIIALPQHEIEMLPGQREEFQ
jgi:hypothetical protein